MENEFKQLSIEQITGYVTSLGMPKFRAQQILEWVYSKHVSEYSEMTNLPKAMRSQLDSELPILSPSVVSRQESKDGSRKYALEFPDGALCETVGMPSQDGRLTVCISSQAGCAMACAFCATGKQGLQRSLFPGEYVDQVLVVQDDFGMRVTNIVVMGQGEPFANYENTLNALEIINHPKYLNIGARHITVSTCGIIEGINRFSEVEEQFTLAVSLHSARQEVRDHLMPTMANQRLGALRKALVNYTESTGRRFTFEYALMEGINDSEDDLKALVSYCKRLLCHVNLIPLNKVDGSGFLPVSDQVMDNWCDRLNRNGIAATVRNSRGSDIDAACGQLSGKLSQAH